jgi:hypothetical protein
MSVRGGSRLRQASMKNFNPRLIFSQIVALQCFHYLFLGLLFQINWVLYGQSVKIERMFTDDYLKIWHNGWQDAIAVFLSYAVVGYVLNNIIIIILLSLFCVTSRIEFFLSALFYYRNHESHQPSSLIFIV